MKLFAIRMFFPLQSLLLKIIVRADYPNGTKNSDIQSLFCGESLTKKNINKNFARSNKRSSKEVALPF